MSDGVEVHVGWTGHTRIDFDKKKIRKALRVRGRDIQKEARRLVARRAVSDAGNMPGRDTGALQRSIKARVSRPGFLVSIRPHKTAEMGDDFYPAFLYYGVRRDAKRRTDRKKQVDNGKGWRIEPRGNFMTEALARRRDVSQTALKAALQDALIPR
jgi:hypothetical protein